jgi:hypothetical protein
MLHFVLFHLFDILEKAKPSTQKSDHWLLRSGSREGLHCTGQRGTLKWWSCTTFDHGRSFMATCICHNLQNCSLKEWILLHLDYTLKLICFYHVQSYVNNAKKWKHKRWCHWYLWINQPMSLKTELRKEL